MRRHPTEPNPRSYLAPGPNRPGYLWPRPWEPLSEEEWSEIGGFLAMHDCGMSFGPRRGRPPEDVRSRLDAIFRAVTLKHVRGGRGSWRQLPEAYGKPDTISRTFRRWWQRGLWRSLLSELAAPHCSAVLQRLGYWICCAYRRAYRLMALRDLLLARRLGLFSALPVAPEGLPRPDLSEAGRRHAIALAGFAQARSEDMRRVLRIARTLLAWHWRCQGWPMRRAYEPL